MWIANTFPRRSELLKENLGNKYEMFICKLLVTGAQEVPKIHNIFCCPQEMENMTTSLKIL